MNLLETFHGLSLLTHHGQYGCSPSYTFICTCQVTGVHSGEDWLMIPRVEMTNLSDLCTCHSTTRLSSTKRIAMELMRLKVEPSRARMFSQLFCALQFWPLWRTWWRRLPLVPLGKLAAHSVTRLLTTVICRATRSSLAPFGVVRLRDKQGRRTEMFHRVSVCVSSCHC
jgi:hypothetical protein